MEPDRDPASRPLGQLESANPPPATTGTGSALGIGCIIVVIVLVVVAFLVRWIAGTW